MEAVALLTLLLLLILFAGRSLFQYWINPLTCWFVPWCVVLCLFLAQLIDYGTLEPLAVAAIGLSFLGYFLGVMIAEATQPATRQAQRIGRPSQQIRAVTVDQFSFRLLTVVGVISVGFLIIHFVAEHGVAAMLAGTQRAMRRAGEGGRLPIIPFAGFHLLLAASVQSGIRMAERGRVDYWDFAILCGFMGFMFLRAGRAILLYWALCVLLGYVLRKHHGRSRMVSVSTALVVIALGILGLGLFVWMAESRGSSESFEYQSLRRGLFTGSVLSGNLLLGMLYIYVTASIASLNHYLVNFDGAHTWGASFAYPITQQLAKLDVLELRFFQGFAMQAAETFGGSNVYTLLRVCYLDFGLLGCFMIPALLGFAGTILYRRYRRTGSERTAIILAYIMLTVLAAPYEYMLYSTISVLGFVGAIAIISVVRRRRGDVQRKEVGYSGVSRAHAP
jgi:oligosaccharide repeat unit polymerase